MNKNSVAIIKNYESYFYFFAWSCSVAYSVYQLYLSTSYFDNYYDKYSDFNPGWTWIGKKQDIADHEWRVWLALVNKLVPCVLIHHFISQIIKVTSNNIINKSHQYWNYQKLQTFTINLIRYMFWLYLTELLLHFIYVNAVQYHPQVVRNLNPWALYGFGYCMGQFFLNKYVVIYGTCSTLCNLDDMKAPPQPKCIARIYLYSDMWKYFDRGLYKFLVKYIYIPTRRSDGGFGKLFSSFLCFTFVLIWHGMQTSIFIWALLNFIGVTIEDIGVSISKTEQYHKIQNTYLSSRNSKRLHCILASPLLAMSAISNFYFFGGQEIGNIFLRNVLYGSWKALFILLLFLYCACQVSLDVKNWELRRVKK
ncbi:protein-cysteine N-palmitoyltransferase HHAT isoform X2 [Linepithema humile]|uniref:protein-cysteine N-palmitoyltransferase HHAT isoform X2 n=1 Tax=Linepithema humile TaxID=83485 RepID=UPI00351E2D7D